MRKIFFVGAGASAQAGYPITRYLTYPLAAYMTEHAERHGGKPSRLYEYLKSVYCVSDSALLKAAKEWKRFVEDAREVLSNAEDFLPSIIEILSIIDIAASEGWSLGPSEVRTGRQKPREFVGNDRIIEALVIAFRDLKAARSENDVTTRLVKRMSADDAIITTNWDVLLDEAIAQSTSAPADYGVTSAMFVNRMGDEIGNGRVGRRLFKLHGSFNWLVCPRCGNLYINTELMIAPGKELRGRFPHDQQCHCKAELQGLIITPSYIKEYRSFHIAHIWHLAQRALVDSEEWIFIGYSLPDDDLWVKGLLLRALAIRRGERKPPKVTVVTRGRDADLERRFRRLFTASPPKFQKGGLRQFLE
jgi:NAD-dependent SIR2 family protein deacetylase